MSVLFFVVDIQEKEDGQYDKLVETLYDIHPEVAKAVALAYFMRVTDDVEIEDDIDKAAIRRALDEFCESYAVEMGSEHWVKEKAAEPTKPKKPKVVDGFAFFKSQFCANRKNRNREVSLSDLMKEATKAWAALSLEEKAPYNQKAEARLVE